MSERLNCTRDRIGKGARVWRESARIVTRIALFLLCNFALIGQGKEDYIVNQVTPESQFLDLVDLVSEPQKQLELLDAFLVQFPKYEGMNTVHSQLQGVCVMLKLWDRALSFGDKLLKLDDGDIEAVRLNLKAAEGKNDPALIAKWRDRLKQLEPPEGEVTASSTVRIPFVDDDPVGELATLDLSALPKNQKPRVEAILFNRALEERDPKRKLQLLSVFERNFPSSSHLAKVRYLFFVAHQEAQDHPKTLAVAEAILERDKTREDVLFYVAQTYFITKKEPAKVLSYSSTILDILTMKQQPENMTEEQWVKQKHMLTLHAHWMIGATSAFQERWNEADKSLRTALALAEGHELTAAILSNLGWSNYKLRSIPDALKFYQQCAGIRSQFQAAAAQSIVSIKSEYNLQ